MLASRIIEDVNLEELGQLSALPRVKTNKLLVDLMEGKGSHCPANDSNLLEVSLVNLNLKDLNT